MGPVPEALLILGEVSLPVPIVQLDPELPLPAYAHEGDAGLDLYAREGATLAPGGGRALVPTGISIARFRRRENRDPTGGVLRSECRWAIKWI